MSLAVALRPLLGAAGARSPRGGGGALGRAGAAFLHGSGGRGADYSRARLLLLGDRATKRFTKYSKIFTVDGNLRAHKGRFAEQLARHLDMRYFPEADIHYIDKAAGREGPVDAIFTGNCSLQAFYENPKNPDGNSYRLQAYLFACRILQYADALDHLFTTGQGVVLERSPYSDFVFIDAMSEQGYIRKECVEHYKRMKDYSMYRFLPPHLVFYIDVPVPEVLKRIEETGKPYEKKVSPAYLQSIEDAYKKSFLPQMSEKCELLHYTPSEIEDMEIVFEEIDLLKFEKGVWPQQTDDSLHELRLLVQDKMQVMIPTCLSDHIEELSMSGQLLDKMYNAWHELPGNKYQRGYNADVGDKWIWLK